MNEQDKRRFELSKIQKLFKEFLQESLTNDKDFVNTSTNIHSSLDALSMSNRITFRGLKNTSNATTVRPYSQALTPVIYAFTERIDFGRLYGQFIVPDPEDPESETDAYGDIYDEKELKQIIEDLCASYYKTYYNVDMPDNFRSIAYQTVIEVMAASLALYALIVTAWSFQNMRNSRFTVAGNKGRMSQLFATRGAFTTQGTDIVYPFKEITITDNLDGTPMNWSFSNAEWVQQVLDHLEFVWLPYDTAKFWREIFGSTYMLTNKLERDRGAINLVKFLPYFTANFVDFTSDDNLYNQLVYDPSTTKDEFLAMLDSLGSSVSTRLSKYPWLSDVLTALGCDFHGFKYKLDGSGNITTEANDDFTRSLVAKNVNLIYDSDDAIRNVLLANSLINVQYNIPEDSEANNFAYNYEPFEISYFNEVAKRADNIFNSIVVTDIRMTALCNPTSFDQLLRGNLTIPLLTVVTEAKSGNNPSQASSAGAKMYFAPGFRALYNYVCTTSNMNGIVFWSAILEACSIPMPRVLVKCTIASGADIATQVNVSPYDLLSIYDNVNLTGYTDIDRARSARRFLFVTNSKIGMSKPARNNNNNEKRKPKPDKSEEGKQ